MAEFDLTPKIAEFVDVHLLLGGVLQFLRDRTDLYARETILHTELDLCKKTKLVSAPRWPLVGV
jgi:hypothetical protein